MKKLIIIIISLLGSATILSAQDIITTSDGTDIEAKILEVNTNEVKYKKYNNQDGPTFTILKSDILIVRYENGENEVFKNSTTSQYTPNASERVELGMKYREYKDLYNAKEYIPQIGDPYSRGWAGVASFFIPGLGQAIDGEWGRAAGFFFGNLGLGLLSSRFIYIDFDYGNVYIDNLFYLFLAAQLGLDIWSICDAVHVAKVKNMYFQDIRGQHAYLDVSVKPFVAFTPAYTSSGLTPTAGLSMNFTF